MGVSSSALASPLCLLTDLPTPWHVRAVRSPKEDIVVIGMYGGWESERDPLMSACQLLLLFAKAGDQPRLNLHRLANALESGNVKKAQKMYDRLVGEVNRTLPRYPDLVGTLETMSEMSDEDLERIDEVMRNAEA